jgi:tyrosyl-tRNA synthetase
VSDVLRTLRERGYISQCSDEEALGRLLDQGTVTFYVGFDPTGQSLHVGHLVPLFAMAHLQRAGHRAVCLAGGGTARIGDPSGRSETRKMLSLEEIGANVARFQSQFARFLDFEGGRALMLDNAAWLAPLNYIDFLRDIGRHFSVNRMLSFEAYKARLETGLSFIEFNYQLLQSFDYLVLYREHGCRLQMGGDDQWGNIVAGMELIRRVEGAEAFALTSPLVTRSDGKKMGKTERGALYLDPEVVSPYEFYQYWINVPDADVLKLLLLLTFVPTDEARRLGALQGADTRLAKETLALELTAIVHGRAAAEGARDSAHAVFGGGGDAAGVPTHDLARSVIEGGMGALDLFVASGLCASRSEARRLVDQGGATVNGRRVRSAEERVGAEELRDGILLLRAGKKRYARVRAI